MKTKLLVAIALVVPVLLVIAGILAAVAGDWTAASICIVGGVALAYFKVLG